MSKSEGSPSSPPSAWEALFSSVTRPHPVAANDDDGDPNSAAGGYTILIQHSLSCKSLRQHASSSSSSFGRGLGLGRGNDAAGYGMSCPFLVGQAFEELCRRCDGSVVFVSLLGAAGGGVLDIDDLDDANPDVARESRPDDGSDNHDANDDDHHDDDHCGSSKGRSESNPTRRDALMRRFRRYGACVDLSSDPFGWEEDQYDDDDVADDRNDDARCNSSFVQKCTMKKLRSIALAIRRAAASVESRRPSGHNQRDTTTMHRRRAVPIVFDTLTPLLNSHGVERVIALLKCLRMVHPSVLSPIVVPVLHESLRPSEMRYLEDVSDAMVHLKLMGSSLNGGDYGSSASANDASNSNNTATVVSFGMMDLVRRGGGGGGGGIRGGKLMHHCVPLRIMRRSLASSIGRGDQMDVRGSYYWIFDDHSDFDATEDFGDKARSKQALTNQSSGRSTKSMNAEAGDQRKQDSSNVTASSGPRIYYEDNDPEFVDYDEEEGLDDDLDL